MPADKRPLDGSAGSQEMAVLVGEQGAGVGAGSTLIGELANGEGQDGCGEALSEAPPAYRRGNGYSGNVGGDDPDAGRRQSACEGSVAARYGGGCVQFARETSDEWRGNGFAGPTLSFREDAHDVAAVPKSTSISSDDDNMSFPRVPPHQRVSVVFQDLVVSAGTFFSKEKKVLLHGLSGQFRAGELIAVMGPSGAGKTTLLNTISGFSPNMMSGGLLSLQHEDGSVTRKRRTSCYLTQDDHVQPLFTAREIVMHAANLKVGSRLSRKAKGLLVDDLLETLGLEGCSYTRANQLSGGQRKRLAIAAELVDNPCVIFLDEPTSGLDMSSATQCTQLLRRIARSGRAVICTIHQPSEKMLSMFDQIYLLANGHCAYRGPPAHVLSFLNSLGFQCPQYHNPADFMLEVANNEFGDAVPLMIEAVERTEYPPPLPDIKECKANGRTKGNRKSPEIEALISVDMYQPSEWERFRVLVTHNLLMQHRDWVNTNIKLFAAIITSLTIGLIFGPIGDNAERIISNISFFFILALYMCYTPEAPAVMKYPDEVQVVKREWFNNWYHLCTYSLALFISSLPMHVMISTIVCSIAYYMTGQLAEPLRFAHVTMALILTSLAAESIGLQFGSLFLQKKIISLFIASTHLAYQILFSGFVALKPEMPIWFHWATTFNHMHFSLNSIVLSVYKGRGRIGCPEDVVYCHLRESDSVLALFGLANADLWHNLVALVGFIVVIRITGYITLNYNVKRVNL